MGFLDTIESMAGQNQNAQVAGGLIQELQQHPGGVGSIMDAFRNNGMGEHVNNWATGQAETATPDQVQTGLGGTGIIDRVAARVGVSPEVATIALSTIMPLVIRHFTDNQGVPVPQSNYGALASNIFNRLI